MNNLQEFNKDCAGLGGLWYAPYVASKLKDGYEPSGVVEPYRIADFLNNTLQVRQALTDLLKEKVGIDTDEGIGLYVKESGDDGRILPVVMGKENVNVAYPVELYGERLKGRYDLKRIQDVMRDIRLWIGSSPILADFVDLFEEKERSWKASYVGHEKEFDVQYNSISEVKYDEFDIEKDYKSVQDCSNILRESLNNGFDIKVESVRYAGVESCTIELNCYWLSEANRFINWLSGRDFEYFRQLGERITIFGFSRQVIEKACDIEGLDLDWS